MHLSRFHQNMFLKLPRCVQKVLRWRFEFFNVRKFENLKYKNKTEIEITVEFSQAKKASCRQVMKKENIPSKMRIYLKIKDTLWFRNDKKKEISSLATGRFSSSDFIIADSSTFFANPCNCHHILLVHSKTMCLPSPTCAFIAPVLSSLIYTAKSSRVSSPSPIPSTA